MQMRTYLALFAVLALTVAGCKTTDRGGMEGSGMSGYVKGMSKFSYSETVSEVKRAIENADLMILKEIDHQEMLKMVGVQSMPMVTLEFFHPRYGKTLREAVMKTNNPTLALRMPLRLIVMEGKMGVMFLYEEPSHVWSGVRELESTMAELDGALERIVGRVKKSM